MISHWAYSTQYLCQDLNLNPKATSSLVLPRCIHRMQVEKASVSPSVLCLTPSIIDREARLSRPVFMPRTTQASDVSKQYSMSRSGDMTRGGPAPAATPEDVDIDHVTTFPTDTLSSSALSTPQSSRAPISTQVQSSHNLHTSAPAPYPPIRDTLDISPENKQTRKDLLRQSFFSDWKDDASSADLGDPDEMQRRDPLGTQIWKLYSKTRSQLPNQERLENLSWRMMAMNLKRKEREQARYVGDQMSASLCTRHALTSAFAEQSNSQPAPLLESQSFESL